MAQGDFLISKFFHTFNVERLLAKQGEVVAAREDGEYYLVHIFSWTPGSGMIHAELYHIDDMKKWRFYDEHNHFCEAGQALQKRTERELDLKEDKR